jgi:hypothetical protein
MRLRAFWALVPLMTLVTGCDLGRHDYARIAHTINILDGILRGDSAFDPEVLPACFKAREALKVGGPRALRQPVALWAIMHPARVVRSDKVFSLDIAWLTLDDASIAGVYFVSSSGSRPEVVKSKMVLEWVDAGTAYSVRFHGQGNFRVVKDLSVESAMRLGLLLITFDEGIVKEIPPEWRTATVVLPREFDVDRKLSFGLLLRDDTLSEPIRILRRDRRDEKMPQ